MVPILDYADVVYQYTTDSSTFSFLMAKYVFSLTTENFVFLELERLTLLHSVNLKREEGEQSVVRLAWKPDSHRDGDDALSIAGNLRTAHVFAANCSIKTQVATVLHLTSSRKSFVASVSNRSTPCANIIYFYKKPISQPGKGS